jgi:acyl-CoA synthetase (AMP-forming)/AMP-acid ligase II
VDWITKKLSPFSEQTACHEAQRAWSYRDFLACIDQLVISIESASLPPQTVVSIQLEYSVEGLAALIASARTQLIAVPLPNELPEHERTLNKQIAGVEWSLTSSDGAFQLSKEANNASARPGLLNQLAGRHHAGLILFSSGTSGAPKAMLHDLNALLNRYQSVRPRMDRSLLLLLIDHIGGLDSAFRTLFSGSTLVIPDQRTPESASAAIAAHKVNILPASPTFLNLMLLAHAHEKYDCSSIEIIAYGAESMPQPLLDRIAEAYPHADLQQKFGTSETGAIRIKSTQRNSLFFQIADADTEWKVVNEELWLKTPSRILGYLNADETSLEAEGWYRTGDIVEEGPDHSIRIIGRESDWINVGGQKVHPAEIEAVIVELPSVTACRVFSKQDAITGNAIACEIVSSDKSDLRSWKRAIRNHCRGKLSPWKIPSSITVTAELSVTPRMKRN